MMAILCLLAEGLSLLGNPRSIQVASTLRDDDLTAFKAHEEQNMQVDDASNWDRMFRKEVTDAQCLGTGIARNHLRFPGVVGELEALTISACSG